jgi:hypothetical protein
MQGEPEMIGLAFWFFQRNSCLIEITERNDKKISYCRCHPPPSA